jgi:transcriptional regulator with XRE-family HTH domain
VDKRLAPEKRLGLALRERRESLGWSQETLAFESGLHRTYIGAVERGEKNVTLRNAIRMARAMQSSLSEMLLVAGL